MSSPDLGSHFELLETTLRRLRVEMQTSEKGHQARIEELQTELACVQELYDKLNRELQSREDARRAEIHALEGRLSETQMKLERETEKSKAQIHLEKRLKQDAIQHNDKLASALQEAQMRGEALEEREKLLKQWIDYGKNIAMELRQAKANLAEAREKNRLLQSYLDRSKSGTDVSR